jgi:type II secretory pathway predicted ATPase ExeA
VHIDQPFTAVHSSRLMLLTDARRDALARLDEGLGAREPFLLITGHAGTGKSALVHEAVVRWGARVSVAALTASVLTRVELIEEIARRFGAEPAHGASKPALLACLEGALAGVAGRGQVAVLVIEDAHGLRADLLEELRLIAGAQLERGQPLEIVLVGLPSLEARLAEPGMEPLRQRVGARCRLEPLTPKETRHYLHHRASASGADGPRLFPRRTCGEIHAIAGGVPRTINTLAAEALRRARKAGVDAVTADHVRAAAAVLPATARAAAPAWTAPDADASETAEAEVPGSLEDPDDGAERGEASADATPAVAPEARPEPAAAPRPAAEAAAPEPAAAPEAERPAARPPDRPAAHEPTSPAAQGTERAAGPEARRATASVADAEGQRPAPRVSASDDPRAREWVARFIGDQGPLRLGSRAAEGGGGLSDADLGFGEGEPSADQPFSNAAVAEEGGAGVPSPAPRRRRRVPPRAARSVRPRRPVAVPAAAIGALAVAALASVTVLPWGWGLITRRAPAPTAASSEAPRQAETATRPAATRSRVTPVRADSSRASGTPATFASRARPADPSASPKTGASSRQRFTLEIGTFVDRGRALAERDRLANETGLDSWMIDGPGVEDGLYPVVLGIYRTRERAEVGAGVLIERGLISHARVTPLPPRRQRR